MSIRIHEYLTHEMRGRLLDPFRIHTGDRMGIERTGFQQLAGHDPACDLWRPVVLWSSQMGVVLMGSVGVSFPLTAGLDAVWGYEPSLEAMRKLLDVFAYDRSLVTDELAELRYQASIRPGFQESFAAMFPAPRQRWVDALGSPEEAIRALPHDTLILHGREDEVIPLSASLRLAELIDRAQLHVFGRCGHWTQIEHADRFARLVNDFLNEADNTATGGA